MTFTNPDFDDLAIPTPPTSEASRRYQASRDATEACQDARTARFQLAADIAGFIGIVAGIWLFWWLGLNLVRAALS